MPKRSRPQYVKLTDAHWDALTPAQQDACEANFKAGLGGKGVPAAASAPAPAEDNNEPGPELVGIRNWNEPIGGISAERLRNCIIYLLDVKKDAWYTQRLTRGFVRSQAERIDADVPEDYVWEVDPLVGQKTVHLDEGDRTIPIIRRKPRDKAERKKIKSKFGVNVSSIPYLAKADCPQCHGTGYYYVSSYPDDPVYSKLQEAVECRCSYE